MMDNLEVCERVCATDYEIIKPILDERIKMRNALRAIVDITKSGNKLLQQEVIDDAEELIWAYGEEIPAIYELATEALK